MYNYHMKTRAKSRVKNTNDLRYQNTQRRLNKVIERYVRQRRITRLKAKVISYVAKVNVSTFYDHYGNIEDALNYVDNRMKEELKNLKKEINATREDDLQKIYVRILHFIYKNKDYYEMITYRKNQFSLQQITEIFRPIICQKWNKYKDADIEMIFQIFAWEFSGVVYCWAQNDKFNEHRIVYYAKKLEKLTNTACQRLV